MEDKRYICRFCGTNATKTNSRGNCISCGAPIAMKDFVVEETPKMAYEELNRHDYYQRMPISGSTLNWY